MSKYTVVVDSTADISKEEAAKYGIKVAPLNLFVGGEEHIEGVTISPEEFVEKMRKAKEIPSSSQPSPGQFAEIYEEIKAEGKIPFPIVVSKEVSGTYQSAMMAVDIAEVENHVIDSRTGSAIVKYAAFEAVKMFEEGKTPEEVTARVKEMVANSKFSIGLKSVDNLIKNGRLSKSKGTITSILNIKPIVKVDNGIFVPEDKVRGFGKVINFHVDKVKETIKTKQVTHACVMHTGAYDEAVKLQSELQAILPNVNVEMCHASAVFATQLGETLALAFITE